LLEGKYPVGSRHKGKVRNLTNFGAFVELEEGIDGLIHISDLSWIKKIRHPAEVVKKGDTIDVVVLNVDRDNRRISLGYKQIMENPWDTFEDLYKVGTTTKAKVVRLIEKGVIAELNNEVDGFIPLSHLAKSNISKPADAYKVGDEFEVCVIEFSKEAKKIVCSEKIDYAQSLIRQKQAEGKPIVDDTFTDDFNLDEYLDEEKPSKSKPAEKKQEITSTEITPEIPEEKETKKKKSPPKKEAPAEESAPEAETVEEKQPEADDDVSDKKEETAEVKEEDTATEDKKDEEAAEPKKPAKTTKKKKTAAKKADDKDKKTE